MTIKQHTILVFLYLAVHLTAAGSLDPNVEFWARCVWGGLWGFSVTFVIGELFSLLNECRIWFADEDD